MISASIVLDLVMASGRTPAGDRPVRIRPLLPENEVPSGRTQDWLTVHNSEYPNRVQKVVINNVTLE